MKNYRIKNLHFAFLSVGLACTLLSCNTKEEIQQLEETISNTRTLTEANELAQTIPNSSRMGNGSARLAAGSRPIKNSFMITDEDPILKKKATDTLMYVCNYENGYSIIAADKRLPDVFAIIDKGNLNKTDKIPDGMFVWLSNTSDLIKAFKKSGLALRGKKSGRIASIEATSEVLTPLVNTTWDQGCGYNDLLTTTTCNSGGCGGRAWTGCVATSMAQLMKYWGDRTGKPNGYNWGAMNLSGSTNETAKLMRDAGTNVDMQYGCSGSGAYLYHSSKLNARDALRNHFGFTEGFYKAGTSCSYYTDYFNDVINSLENGRPVILEGYASANYTFGYLTSLSDGHAWICDGYKSVYNPQSYYNYQTDRWVGSTTYFVHMNWGWGGSNDGWFSTTSFGSSQTGNQMPYNFQHNVGGLFNFKI